MHHYDKKGSHENAILKGLNKRKELNAQFEKMLKGHTYEEWLIFSKRLSVLNYKFKTSKTKKDIIAI